MIREELLPEKYIEVKKSIRADPTKVDADCFRLSGPTIDTEDALVLSRLLRPVHHAGGNAQFFGNRPGPQARICQFYDLRDVDDYFLASRGLLHRYRAREVVSNDLTIGH